MKFSNHLESFWAIIYRRLILFSIFFLKMSIKHFFWTFKHCLDNLTEDFSQIDLNSNIKILKIS